MRLLCILAFLSLVGPTAILKSFALYLNDVIKKLCSVIEQCRTMSLKKRCRMVTLYLSAEALTL